MQKFTQKQLVEEGRTAYQKGEYLSAAKLFQAAAEGFLSEGDNLAWAEMSNNSSVAYLRSGDATLALDAAGGTDQIFATAGDYKRQAMALGNQAAALEKLKRYGEALDAYEKSAELFKALGDDELRAIVYQSISNINLRLGHYLEAYAIMRLGVSGIKRPNVRQKILRSLMDIPVKIFKLS